MADEIGALAVRYGAVSLPLAADAQVVTEEEEDVGEENEEGWEDEGAGSSERTELRFSNPASVETPKRGMKFV